MTESPMAIKFDGICLYKLYRIYIAGPLNEPVEELSSS